MAKGAQNQKKTRKFKQDTNVTYLEKTGYIKDKTPLEPLNERQRDYINAINTDSVIICTGKLGTSKTYIPSVIAADMLSAKDIEKIIIARPAEGAGKSSGYLPGTQVDKLSPWCEPVVSTLKKRMGTGHYEAMLENGRIELMDLSMCKGRNLDDTFLIVDEAEDIDVDVVKTLVTRQGIRSKVVICGDVAQQDLKKHSGLQYLLNVIQTQNLQVSTIDFDSWDHCVRGEEAKMWGMAFEAYEKG